jgi:outer membrane receptor protein involved in Fe transport
MNRFLTATALVTSLSMLPAYSQAQNAGSPVATPNASATDAQVSTAVGSDPTVVDETPPGGTGNEIVVTGSRIRRPNLESTVPIASIRSQDIYSRADPNVGEALNDLPQLRSTFSQQNPGSGIGVAGLNLLDLRGLGVQRTLVLVNGRRHVPSDIQNTAAAVDTNTIPTDLIERIDIVTGGNSAVYGSDAISGVVNFVLKNNFDGLQLRAGNSIPQFGSGGNRYISGIAGKNFADGRGNLTAAVEYSKQDRLFGSQIPYFRQANGFVTNDVDGAGLANGSDGIPDLVFGRDIRSSTIARFGLVPVVQTRNTAAPCGTGIPGGSGARTNYNCNYLFDSTGNLVPQTGNRISTGPTGTFLGGNGDNNREDRLLSVLPKNERFSANLLGHFKVSDAADFFVEAKYARAHTVGSNSGPAFNQGFNQTFSDYRANYRLDNPFLNSAARTTLTNAILASGSNTSLTGGAGALTATDRAAIADGSYRFTNARNFSDLGIRDEDTVREVYRIVAGVRGDVTPHVNYELSGNYGRANQKITILGNVNQQRLLLAQDAGIDPNNPGAGIQCRSKFDPAARVGVADLDGNTVAAARLAGDIAACVPYNAFGGLDNSAARNYIVSNSGSRGRLSQYDATGFVNVDSGGFFNLPGGAIAVVLGGEYRREDANFVADPDVQDGLTFLNALQTFDPPTLEVAEGFGELNVPILKDMPFFNSLSLSGAARYSHYNKAYGSTGSVWAWNFGGEWSPIRDIRFRANYGKAVRAPNYTDTASPTNQDFAPGFLDPCNAGRIGSGTPQRSANCQAALGGLINNAEFQGLTNLGYSLEILSGSNPLLEQETSKSLTVGAVFTPRFLPGFDLTIDYFDINVKNVITAATAQQIVDLCYDNSQFCNLFQRYTGSGTGPNGEVPGQILQGSLTQASLNFASLKRRGIDVQANYNHSIGEDARLNLRGSYTHQLRNSNYTDPTRPDFETRILGQLGDPKDEFTFNADLTLGQFTVGYGAHYIGPMFTTAYANLYPINGNPAQNVDVNDIRRYPDVVYHNVRASVQLGSDTTNRKGMEWFVGIDNLGNRKPPLGTTATGAGSAIYEVIGRSFFTGVRATF